MMWKKIPKEFGDKLPADKKGPIEAALEKLKEAHKVQDIAGIDAATTEYQINLRICGIFFLSFNRIKCPETN